MKILDKYQEELNKATELITNGEIIAIPTDTYYGLACDPFNFESLKKLFELKEREVTKPLPLLISSKEDNIVTTGLLKTCLFCDFLIFFIQKTKLIKIKKPTT